MLAQRIGLLKVDSKYGRIYTQQDAISLMQLADDPVDQSFGQILEDFTGTFPPGEPVFVLRAKDKSALDTLADYRANAKAKGAGGAHLDNVTKAIDEFRNFARNNPDKMKIPD
jgi:hypothetical protein